MKTLAIDLRRRTIWMLFAVFAVACGLAGCSSVGLQQPRSVHDTVKYTEATLAGAYKTIADGYEAKTITPEAAVSYRNRLRPVDNAVIDAQHLLAIGDTAGADNRIQAALLVLNEIQLELAKRAAQPK